MVAKMTIIHMYMVILHIKGTIFQKNSLRTEAVLSRSAQYEYGSLCAEQDSSFLICFRPCGAEEQHNVEAREITNSIP